LSVESAFDDQCGFLAVRTCLSLLGDALTLDEIHSIHRRLGHATYSFGIATPHLALIAARQRHVVTIRSSSQWLALIHATAGEAVMTDSSEDALSVRRALQQFRDRHGTFVPDDGSERSGQMYAALEDGAVCIACVSAEDFYGIPERWNHYVVVTRVGEEIVVHDPWSSAGERSYAQWTKHAEQSRRFAWNEWRGDLIEVRRA
jgi:hypothetical protein